TRHRRRRFGRHLRINRFDGFLRTSPRWPRLGRVPALLHHLGALRVPVRVLVARRQSCACRWLRRRCAGGAAAQRENRSAAGAGMGVGAGGARLDRRRRVQLLSRMARSTSLISGYYAIVETPEQAAPLLAHTRIVQLRNKRASAQELLSTARKLRELTRKSGVAFCVNDRVDIALLAEADAVHLGQDDPPLAAARALAGDRLIIGISTHSVAQAQAALEGGADYLGFGPVFATASKENPDPVQGLQALAEIVRLADR